MSAVIVTLVRLVAVEHDAANAAHQRTVNLRRQLFAARAGGPDLGAKRAIPAAVLKGVVGEFRQQAMPVGLKAGACLDEALRRPLAMPARLKSGIEAARPAPLIGADGNASPFTDRADTHVAVRDVPGLSMWIVAAAAGEGRHAPTDSADLRRLQIVNCWGCGTENSHCLSWMWKSDGVRPPA